ncbi:MAG: T9SS type A sorting domain-containing protein [Bacteroidales bacterium]|nr:T9SS type A sorting domain-containing protein [Bacteroidales bacterium]
MNKNIFVLLAVLLAATATITAQKPTVTMTSVDSISSHKARFTGYIDDITTTWKPKKVGFVLAPKSNANEGDTINYAASFSGTKAKEFSYYTKAIAYYLKPSTEYWIVSFTTDAAKTNPDTVFSSDTLTFTTLAGECFYSQPADAEDISLTTAKVFGQVTGSGDAEELSGYGFVYATTPNPTVSTPGAGIVQISGKVSKPQYPITFDKELEELKSGATYYFRVWIAGRYTNVYYDTCYSDQKMFVTPHACGSTPFGLDTLSVGINEVELTWTPNIGQVKFEVDYGLAGHTAGDGTIVASDTTYLKLTNLMSNRSYTAFVRAVCEDSYSEWSELKSFRTREAPCENISGLHVSEVTYMTAKIEWTPGTSKQNMWEVMCLKATQAYPIIEQGYVVTGDPMYFPVGLTPKTEYKLKVRAKCQSVGLLSSDWSEELRFTTNANGLIDAQTVTDAVKIYPNPSNDVINFEGNAAEVSKVEVYSSLGTLIYTSEFLPEQINLSKYGTGTYIIHVYTDYGVQTEKVIVK